MAARRSCQGYRLPESKEIYDTLGFGEIVRTTLRSLVLVPRTAWRCLRMPQRWPWSAFDALQEERLVDLRARYGIRVP